MKAITAVTWNKMSLKRCFEIVIFKIDVYAIRKSDFNLQISLSGTKTLNRTFKGDFLVRTVCNFIIEINKQTT